MVGPLEFCPKCRQSFALDGSCSTIISIGLRRTARLDSEDGTEIIFHVHCRSCNAYIRSYPMIAESEEPGTIEISQYSFFVEEQNVTA